MYFQDDTNSTASRCSNKPEAIDTTPKALICTGLHHLCALGLTKCPYGWHERRVFIVWKLAVTSTARFGTKPDQAIFRFLQERFTESCTSAQFSLRARAPANHGRIFLDLFPERVLHARHTRVSLNAFSFIDRGPYLNSVRKLSGSVRLHHRRIFDAT